MKSEMLLLILLFFISCSGITPLSVEDRSSLYSENFLSLAEQVNQYEKNGDYSQALSLIVALDETALSVEEQSMRRNLMGQIHLSENNYEKAIFNFDLALAIPSKDIVLKSQILLNLGHSYYKLGIFEKTIEYIDQINVNILSKEDQSNYYLLGYEISKQLGEKELVVSSLAGIVKNIPLGQQLFSNDYFVELENLLFGMEVDDQVSFVEKQASKENIPIGRIGIKLVQNLYYSGKNLKAKNLLEFLEDKYADVDLILEETSNFKLKISDISKIDQKAIGVILPLTGKNKNFGERALKGIQASFKSQLASEGYRLIVKDSKSSPTVGRHFVKELVQKYRIGALIGGLSSQEAKEEYFEAKKNDLLFISLSQVFISRELKTSLLIEVPGSTESEIKSLFTDEVVSKLGNRVAIIYPEDLVGEIYLNEFWKEALMNGVSVTDAISFSIDESDYRSPVEKLLGLKYKRIRQEELDLLEELYALQKKTVIRRVQKLRPRVDFDWVFIPASPLQASQLIPNFNYFDAFDVSIVGRPSWRSRSVRNLSSKNKMLHLMLESEQSSFSDFKTFFKDSYLAKAKAPELRAYQSIVLLKKISDWGSFTDRSQLKGQLEFNKELSVENSFWKLADGQLWLKDMKIHHFRAGKVMKGFRLKQ